MAFPDCDENFWTLTRLSHIEVDSGSELWFMNLARLCGPGQLRLVLRQGPHAGQSSSHCGWKSVSTVYDKMGTWRGNYYFNLSVLATGTSIDSYKGSHTCQ